MRSRLPKVLHSVGGLPLVVHALRAAEALQPERVVVVTGNGAELVEARVKQENPDIQIALQAEQLGTGHAVVQAKEALEGFSGDVLILYGDTPFISPQTLQNIQRVRAEGADIVCLGFDAADPGRYGRLITQGDELLRIVEAKDATPDELAVTLCNSGVIGTSAALLFQLLEQVGNDNAAGEYYLTDIVGMAQTTGRTCRVVTCPESETLGINTRVELSGAEALYQEQLRIRAMENGATLIAPETVFLCADTQIGQDVIIEPNVVIGPNVIVEDGAVIRAFSHLEGCIVRAEATVGPYARLRPGTRLEPKAKIGNFVELKNTVLGEGAKVNHLSYIGDAEVGAGANIGAGVITCNYDGVMKHRTEIGAEAFIGTNCALVAPVRVGDGAMTAAGSVISSDVPDNALGLARSEQVNKEGFVPGFRAQRLARKKANS